MCAAGASARAGFVGRWHVGVMEIVGLAGRTSRSGWPQAQACEVSGWVGSTAADLSSRAVLQRSHGDVHGVERSGLNRRMDMGHRAGAPPLQFSLGISGKGESGMARPPSVCRRPCAVGFPQEAAGSSET